MLARRLLDQPNARSSHQQPTPRGGGVAFVLVAALANVIFLVGVHLRPLDLLQSGLLLIAVPLSVVGFFDDRYSLSASCRYGVQVFTALLLLWLSPISFPWQMLPLLIVAITAVINFTNFMDGLDGLVAGCMAVALAAAALRLASPWPIWALVGALLGFLIWNWSPAKVFMGDVGSTWLGAVFAGMVLQQTTSWRALSLLLVAFPLLADACLCIVRRLQAGQPIFQAHRLHLFQRLQQAGWPHARVAQLYGGATVILALALALGGPAALMPFVAAELLLGTGLDRFQALPFRRSAKSGVN
jgi:UDP-N-acetylmuramyl pentapeptide phosphotransferase/UDP-N-acetylglucosamine-1-phosphate transferase